MEEIGTLYKVRVGFHDDGVTDWFQNFSQGPTWFIEQVSCQFSSNHSTYLETKQVLLSYIGYKHCAYYYCQ